MNSYAIAREIVEGRRASRLDPETAFVAAMVQDRIVGYQDDIPTPFGCPFGFVSPDGLVVGIDIVSFNDSEDCEIAAYESQWDFLWPQSKVDWDKYF